MGWQHKEHAQRNKDKQSKDRHDKGETVGDI